MVSQDIILFDDTVRANVAYANMNASEEQIKKACKFAAAADFIENLPQSFTTKDKISCKKEDVARIISELSEEFPNADTTDGIKIVFDKKNWVMVRPSGTEPIIRIYAESDSEKNLEVLMKEYTQKIKLFLDR